MTGILTFDARNDPNAVFIFKMGSTLTTASDKTPTIGPAGRLVVGARIQNTGTRRGAEVVQLYVRDLVASVTRPVRELKAFQRIALDPGEARTVRFEVPVSELGFIGLEMQYTVEPGEFHLWIAPDAAGGLHGSFRLQR